MLVKNNKVDKFDIKKIKAHQKLLTDAENHMKITGHTWIKIIETTGIYKSGDFIKKFHWHGSECKKN